MNEFEGAERVLLFSLIFVSRLLNVACFVHGFLISTDASLILDVSDGLDARILGAD